MKRTIDRKIKLTDKELRKIIQDALLSYISDNTSNGNSGRIEGNIPDVSDLLSKMNYANDAFVQDNISEINEELIMTHDIHSAKNIICRKFNLQSQQFCITPINFDNTIVNLGVIILEKGTSQNVIGEIKYYMQTLGYFECVKPKYVEEKIVLILVKEEIKKLLSEGIDIKDNTVAFNPSHQDNVDTNDPWNPKPIYNEVDGYRVISVFERKMTDDKQDGNPLIYALKGKQWKFKHPQYDIMALLRRFVAVTKELNEKFDLIITTPSSNPLNNEILKRVVRILSHESYYENFFNKYTANEVYEEFIDSEWLNNTYQDEKLRDKMHSDIYKAICRMNLPKEKNGNDGVFSYKFLKPVELRNAILQSMYINEEFANEITFGEKINGKKVLVIDDTVSTGKTISDSADAIKEMYDPSSITFLTLFSPLRR